jgi:ElaB/YqjD/DUF883 family membrane-anchored ribosome-binding protein
MSDTSRMGRGALDAAAETISRNTESARQRGSELIDSAAERLDDLRNDVMEDDRVQAVSQRARRAASATRDYWNSHDLDDMADNVVEVVRRHPGKALLALIAAGFVFGRMMSRDR